MLSHGNMVANVLQAYAWFHQTTIEHALYYIALPLYHIFSLTANCWLFMLDRRHRRHGAQPARLRRTS